MPKRFNDGIIDLSSLREKKEEKKQVEYNPDAIMETIPQQFIGQDEQGEEKEVKIVSVAIMPDVIYMIMDDGTDENFLMLGKHKNNAFTGDLSPATEEDLVEYNKLVQEYREAITEENSMEEDVDAQVKAARQAQFEEMLAKAESEEERQQILAIMNDQN